MDEFVCKLTNFVVRVKCNYRYVILNAKGIYKESLYIEYSFECRLKDLGIEDEPCKGWRNKIKKER